MLFLSKYTITLLFGVTWLLSLGSVEGAQSLDKAVVVVNNVPITEKAIKVQAELIKQHQPKEHQVSKDTILKVILILLKIF